MSQLKLMTLSWEVMLAFMARGLELELPDTS